MLQERNTLKGRSFSAEGFWNGLCSCMSYIHQCNLATRCCATCCNKVQSLSTCSKQTLLLVNRNHVINFSQQQGLFIQVYLQVERLYYQRMIGNIKHGLHPVVQYHQMRGTGIWPGSWTAVGGCHFIVSTLLVMYQ